jgi:hypothetical protein
VLSIDPTPNLEYSKWVLSKYTKTDVLLEDVVSTFADSLAVFHKAKATKKLPIEHRDIFKIKDFDTLYDITRPYVDVGFAKETLMREAEKGTKILADTNNVLILEITNKAAAIVHGKGTKWCTAVDVSENQANKYLKDGPLYIFINKNNVDERYQLSSPPVYNKIQLKNKLDQDITRDGLLKLLGGLKEAILATKNNYLIDYFLRKPKNWTNFNLLRHILYSAINLPVSLKFYGISKLNKDTINIDAIKKNYTLYTLYLKVTKKSIKTSNFDYENLEIPEDFYLYAKNELKSRFPEAEPIILKDLKIACLYARDVIKGRWKEAEPIIMQSPHVIDYIMKVLKKRWPEAEESIVKYCSSADIEYYIREYVYTIVPVFEKLLVKQLTTGDKKSYSLSPYISNIRQRMPAIEEALLKSKDVDNIFNYAINCIKGQWLEGEEYALKISNGKISYDDDIYFDYLVFLADNKDIIKSREHITKIFLLLENSSYKYRSQELAKKFGITEF